MPRVFSEMCIVLFNIKGEHISKEVPTGMRQVGRTIKGGEERGIRGNFIVVKAVGPARRGTGPETQTIRNNNGPEMETMSVWSRLSCRVDSWSTYVRMHNI